jgi:cell division protein ZapA (FtsZ GTPase activity inhibitor)
MSSSTRAVRNEARKDAFEYARAQMYYGTGAGTRRRLIGASVDHKSMTLPGYQKSFIDALAGQNMDDHAKKAQKERHRRDVAEKIDRNVRGLASGNRGSLTPAVLILVTAAVAAKQTGLDEPIKAEAKKQYNKARSWVKVKQAERKLRRKPKSDES